MDIFVPFNEGLRERNFLSLHQIPNSFGVNGHHEDGMENVDTALYWWTWIGRAKKTGEFVLLLRKTDLDMLELIVAEMEFFVMLYGRRNSYCQSKMSTSEYIMNK